MQSTQPFPAYIKDVPTLSNGNNDSKEQMSCSLSSIFGSEPDMQVAAKDTQRSPSHSSRLHGLGPQQTAAQLLKELGISESSSSQKQVFALSQHINQSLPVVSPRARQALAHVLVSNEAKYDGSLPNDLRKHCVLVLLERKATYSDVSGKTENILRSYQKPEDSVWVNNISAQLGLRNS